MQQGDNQKKNEDGNTVATISKNVVVLSFGEEDCLHFVEQDIEWVVDIAASCHTTPR